MNVIRAGRKRTGSRACRRGQACRRVPRGSDGNFAFPRENAIFETDAGRQTPFGILQGFIIEGHMTRDDIRSRFPHIADGYIYLNHASTGPWSIAVKQMVEKYLHEFTHGKVDNYHDAMRIISGARLSAAGMIGAAPEDIAFVLNTSDGLNLLASGLAWRPGDRILLVDREFPANVYPFMNLRRLGVEIDFAPQRDGVVTVEDVAEGIRPETRLVAVSWVQFLSGCLLDLAQLSALCRDRGVLLSVDAIQGLGALRMNLAETPVDFMSAGVQKWQLGPQGVAIVYTSPSLRERMSQAYLGWLSVQNGWDFFNYENPPHRDSRRYENGTYNCIGLYGYAGALSLFEETGFDAVERMVRDNCEYLYAKVVKEGWDLLTPADPRLRAGIVTFRHERSEEIYEQLKQEKIIISARSGYLRISPHFYNTREEIDTVIERIAALSAR
jgi:cysteine desulfurase / selenocysteine lyase